LKKAIHSDGAPKPIGPYSQAIRYGDLIFCSGQIPIDLKTGELETGPIEKQAHRAFKNIETVLNAAGCDLTKVIKVTLYFKDLGDFNIVNEIYTEYFEGVLPARAAIEVAALPKGALIEIEAIAHI